LRHALAPAAALLSAALLVAATACATPGLDEYGKAEALALLERRGVAFVEQELVDHARSNRVDVVTLLLAAGMDPDALGGKALAMAAAGGRTELLRLLLEAGADPDRPSGSFGQPALISALMRGEIEAARLLLEAGADPDVPTRAGATALFFAQDVETARMLLDAGATVNRRDDAGGTALMSAVVLGDLALVELLLERGADPAVADHSGRSATLLAKAFRFARIEERLYAAGAPPLRRARVSAAALDAYAGRYGRKTVEYQVVEDRGRLYLVEEIGPSLYESELVPLTEAVFFRDGDPGAILFRFERDGDRVVALSRPQGAGTGRVWVPRLP
jgi:hypothetical protein